RRLPAAPARRAGARRRPPPPPAPAAAGPPAPGRPGGSPAGVDPRAEERRARLARHPYLASKARAGALVEEAQRQMQSAPEKALHLLDKAKALGGHAGKDRAPALEVEAKQQLNSRRAEEERKTGSAAVNAGDAEGAAHAYVRASELDPQRADAAYEAARWLLKAGRPLVEARGFALRAVTLRGDHLPSHLVVAEICLRMGM